MYLFLGIKIRDSAKEMEWMFDHREELNEEDGNPAIFYELGPFPSAGAYLRGLFEHSKKPEEDCQAPTGGEYRMMEIVLDAIEEIEKQQAKPPEFVLTHTDLDTQNVLINEDGSLTGILDWDGIHTGPKQIGYAAYPVLLTRDMSPWNYGYYMGDEDEKAREDPPSELRALRKAYRGFFEKHAGAAAAKDTVNSHMYQAVQRACSEEYQLSGIVRKLMRMCLPEDLPIDIAEPDNDDSSVASDSETGDRRWLIPN